MPDPKTVVLCARGEPMRSTVEASIDSAGNLTIAGCDAGDLVREMWGHDDYEYTLTVPAADKDRLLLALLAQHYGDNSEAFAAIRRLLEQHSVPHRFDSWP